MKVARRTPLSRLCARHETLCVRRYLERRPHNPLSLRQVDPLIRQLTLYRDFIADKTKEENEP